MQVPAAVVQVVDLAATWQRQRGQVAERVVLVTERSGGGDFFRQPAEGIVGYSSSSPSVRPTLPILTYSETYLTLSVRNN